MAIVELLSSFGAGFAKVGFASDPWRTYRAHTGRAPKRGSVEGVRSARSVCSRVRSVANCGGFYAAALFFLCAGGRPPAKRGAPRLPAGPRQEAPLAQEDSQEQGPAHLLGKNRRRLHQASLVYPPVAPTSVPFTSTPSPLALASMPTIGTVIAGPTTCRNVGRPLHRHK
eukprot:4582395-Pyramimonas_sp.AAC.1